MTGEAQAGALVIAVAREIARRGVAPRTAVAPASEVGSLTNIRAMRERLYGEIRFDDPRDQVLIAMDPKRFERAEMRREFCMRERAILKYMRNIVAWAEDLAAAEADEKWRASASRRKILAAAPLSAIERHLKDPADMDREYGAARSFCDWLRDYFAARERWQRMREARRKIALDSIRKRIG